MLMERIMGAFTFRKGVYSEVEGDSGFTGTAWMLVAVVAFLNALGGSASGASVEGYGRWIIGAVVGAVIAVIGFAVGMFVISWLGKALFKADVSFNEMVRTLGLAYVWNLVGFLGILGLISATLVCVIAPAIWAGVVLSLIASLIAAKEALDLDWMQTIITVVLAFVAIWVVTGIGGFILGLMGLAAAGAAGLFG